MDGLRDVGWHLGLERMEELCGRLGNPERSFRVIHVVGTNGKSSVTEACRRLLISEGIRAGAYLSPHLRSWSERVRLPDGREPERFAAAVAEAAKAAESMASGACEGAGPTQFELATAAAFVALARDEVEVAVIEAGMGGRLDATNVCHGEVVVLTTVALEHTQWLGDTVEEIAGEKLAVLDPGATLVVGRLDEDVVRLAEAAARAASSPLVDAFPQRTDRSSVHPSDQPPIGSGFAGDNAAVAAAGVGALLDREVAPAGAELPARAQLIEGDPPLLLDLAHNPAAAEALAAHPALAGRKVVACVALLDDKDLDGYAAALAPAIDELIATTGGDLPGSARPGASWRDPATLTTSFTNAGVERATAVSDPHEAVDQTIARAGELGAIALITGSHYLLRHEWIPGRDHSY